MVGRVRSLCLALLLLGGARGGMAQVDSTLARALDLEGRNRFREAAAVYRGALRVSENFEIALLGLERTLHEAGLTDSVVPLLDSLLRSRPGDDLIRGVQMRTLTTLGRAAELRLAYEGWVAAAPGKVTPYREYARVLMQLGRMSEADTILRRAEIGLGATRALALEFAQVRAALGLWESAAVAWRTALEDADYLQRAAIVSLAPAPLDQRPAVREVLLSRPVLPAARLTLSELELGWGAVTQAWAALRDLPPEATSRDAWLAFADRAEVVGAWLPARDALLAAIAVEDSTELAARAAGDAVSGGQAVAALSIVESRGRRLPAEQRAMLFGAVHVRALAATGKAAEAERVAVDYARYLQDFQLPTLFHEVAWGWVKQGQIERARAALERVGDAAEPGEIGGWIALYAGDLTTARAQLRGYGGTARFPATITAMAVLGRTRAANSSTLGAAFLNLARGDSTGSARAFELAAMELTDAGSLMLLVAARLWQGSSTDTAVRIWKGIVERHADTPEAVEAELEWARALRAAGKLVAARERLEHLIISYPGSALVPQARRELELVKASIPPVDGHRIRPHR